MEDSADKKILEAFKVHEHFCKCMIDAYALIDETGKVVKCNQFLSAILGKKPRQIFRAASLDELISFQVSNQPLSIKDILKEKNPSRFDEVSASILDFESDQIAEKNSLNLILGFYPFFENEAIIGAFILIRDVTAETNLQGKYKDKAHQSVTDKLTGMYNRAYFENYLPATLQSMEPTQNLSVIMADIDHFKSINDTYGHPAGDYIIKKVAHLFREKFRKTDVLCRYGGEEFLAILPTTDLLGAASAADKLRKSIETENFSFEDKKINVTISLGIAEVKVGYEKSEQLIARADHALYYSKSSGRNRVSIHLGGDNIKGFVDTL